MAPQDRQPIPDAESAEADPGDMQHLIVGEPFAIAHDCSLVDNACHATVECECGQAFRLNLLLAGVKACPKCKEHYTHVLLICHADNDELVADAFDHVLEANGIELPMHEEQDGEPAEVVDPDDAGETE
jgi:hypothetical protein